MSALDLDAYRKHVALDEPYRTAPDASRSVSESLDIALSHLLIAHDIVDEEQIMSRPYGERRTLLRELLTTWHPSKGSLPDHVISAVDVVLQSELAARHVTDASLLQRVPETFGGAVHASSSRKRDLDGVFSKIALWRGDITSLKVDVIVNAANSALLGCFQPSHKCIDNVIHAAAGPRLRRDCNTIMETLNRAEPVGSAKVTRAYNLPSRFVVHTVGPATRNTDANGKVLVSRKEENQLASSYVSSLELASLLPGVSSIAFCCISTGLFGFPKDRASQIAVATVADWLETHPDSPIKLVVFNVFTDEDLEYYEDVFASIYTQLGSQISPIASDFFSHSAEDRIGKAIDTAASWLRDADCILVAAGAGMSAAAGLDYNDEALFKRLFPAMHRRGHRCMYEFIGFTNWTEKLRWGYLFSQIELARFKWPLHPAYGRLLDIVRRIAPDNHFVMTSNVDGMFERNGFDASRIYTRQGDYARLQCLQRCTEEVWPIKPYMDRALPTIDPKTQEITDPDAVPRCPNCGGAVVMNVRGGDWFIEHPYHAQYAAFQEFIASTKGKRLVVVEVGAGFNTPSVIRWPCEQIVARNPDARLVRINDLHPDFARELGSHAVGITGNAADAIVAIADSV